MFYAITGMRGGSSTSVEELLGQRLFGMCLGYEDLNDHDQLRADPMLAVAVNKADPLGLNRLREEDRGKALAGKSTLNRLELGKSGEIDKYKKILMQRVQDRRLDREGLHRCARRGTRRKLCWTWMRPMI